MDAATPCGALEARAEPGAPPEDEVLKYAVETAELWSCWGLGRWSWRPAGALASSRRPAGWTRRTGGLSTSSHEAAGRRARTAVEEVTSQKYKEEGVNQKVVKELS